ncbi:MAG UNVERIFIED_CONTAM: redoxin domain-containing protein [Thermobifida fusca]|nr:MAG: hypothetical protein DIU72_09720 [Pseudomonadota bacterium]
MKTRSYWLVAILTALVACGEGGTGVGEPSDRTTYPSGPYGTKEGATIANLGFLTLDGEPFELDKDVFKDPNNRVLLLSSVAGWCAPCREEQPQLKAWYEKYKDRGLIIVEALFQNNEFQPASFADLQAWQNQYKLPFPVTLDPDFQLEPFFTTLPPSPPMSILVRVDDMKILKVVLGTGNEQLIESIILANLPR